MTQLARAPGVAADLRRIVSGGGPRRLHVLGVTRPKGLIIPSSRLRLELEARNGDTAHWEPEIPLPLPYAWAYRLSRLLHVPVISSRDPEDLTFSLGLRDGSGRAR